MVTLAFSESLKRKREPRGARRAVIAVRAGAMRKRRRVSEKAETFGAARSTAAGIVSV